MTSCVDDDDTNGEVRDDASEHGSVQSTNRALVDEWDEEESCVPVPSCCQKLGEHAGLACSLVGVVLLLMAASAWLGRLSADSNFLPRYSSDSSSSDSPAASANLATVQHSAKTAFGLSNLVDASPAQPAPTPTPTPTPTPAPHRPAAFMNLLHNTLLPDLSLSNRPYPVNTTRLPGGVMPALSVYYCNNAEWFQYILDDTLPDVFANYTRVAEWDHNMPNLWSLQSFSGDAHPVPDAMNRAIGQRRLFITGEPVPSDSVWDVDAILDTKTSPFAHPAGAVYVYFPNVYAAHYDFIRAGQPTDGPAKYDLSLIKPPHYSQTTNFTGRRFMAYMQNHCVPYRDEFFDLVSQYKRVDGISKCKNNVPDTFDRKGAWWEAVQIYNQYKFVITLESAIIDGYITEKILGPMITGAIPIYIGSGDIGDHFNERAFINVGRFPSLEKVMERIIYLDQNDTAYAEVLDEPWLLDNQPSMWMPHGNKQSYMHQQFAALRDVLLHPNYTQRMGEGLPQWAKEQQGWKDRSDVQYLRGASSS